MVQENLLTRYRVNSIDLLRGLVMVIMALDHVRDFFHYQAITGNPTDMGTTTPILFFTRWITHFCAPTFVFLSGTSAYLVGLKKSTSQLSAFLIKRGFWLILVELILITFALTFNPFFNLFILQVIWAIGISMVLLGIFVWLPLPVILTVGLVIIFGHNVLDAAEATRGGNLGLLWSFVHGSFAMVSLWPNHMLMIFYSFLSWTGIMFAGYCFGYFFRPGVNPSTRRKNLVMIGCSLLALFIIVRYSNVYGDRAPWSSQKNWLFTVMSFVNVTKYPPSLLFTCMTLGVSILFLALIENIRNAVTRILSVYGKVPFFYYVIHFYLIHTVCMIAFFINGHTIDQAASPNVPFNFRPPTFGFTLPVVYLIWMALIALLYPLCKWYSRYKSTHDHWWLSYL